MQLIYPRLVGGLCLIWAVVLQRGALSWPSESIWFAFTLTWLVASILMVLGRYSTPAALVLAGLCVIFITGVASGHHIPPTLLFWLCLTIGITEHRPLERALLIRVTVSVVYAFAALAKLNPSFLSGEHVAGLAANRPLLENLEPLLRSNWGVAVSLVVITTEAFLAIALWLRKTRSAAVTIGIVAHLSFIVVANNGTRWDVAFVTVLNAGLVLSYLAFFSPIHRELGESNPGVSLS